MMDTPPEPLPTQEQVIEQKLLDCGLKAGGFTVRYEDYLQSIEIIVGSDAGVKSEHFACIREAVFPEIVTFEDHSMFQLYMDFEAELLRPQVLADLEASLRQSGLWDNFPDRQNYPALADYARALEIHAGIEPGTALGTESDNQLTFDPPRGEQGYAEFAERYSDLLAVAMYAAAKGQFGFGLITNE